MSDEDKYPDEEKPDEEYPDNGCTDEEHEAPSHVVHTGGNREIDGGCKTQGYYLIPDEDPDPEPEPDPDPEYTYVYWEGQCGISGETNGVEYNEEEGYFEVPAGVTEFYFLECTTYDVHAYYDEYDDIWYFDYL